MKRYLRFTVLALAVILLVSFTAAQAEIIPPQGEGQIGIGAVVEYDNLELRKGPGADYELIKTLPFGSLVIVMKDEDAWAECVLSDAEDAESGWVSLECIGMDPAWYRADNATPVFAWDDTASPMVARIPEGEMVPILKQDGDWIVVTLRSAAGWIYVGE